MWLQSGRSGGVQEGTREGRETRLLNQCGGGRQELVVVHTPKHRPGGSPHDDEVVVTASQRNSNARGCSAVDKYGIVG